MDNEVSVKPSSVIVVGAGIVGAAIAYHLARQGAQVTVLEQDSPGSGVTRHSFAWINPHGEFPPAARALRAQALADYRRLQHELPALQVRWSGALTYGAAEQQAPDTDEPTAEAPTQWLDRAGVAQLEPHLQVLPERARYAPGEGSLDPVAATRTLLDAACTHGARVFDQTRVLGLRVEGQRVLGANTAAGLHRADQVLLASGCATPALLAPLGIQLPVQASPSILIRIHAPPGLVKTLVSNSQLEIREAADGSLLLAEDYIDAQGPQGPEAIAQQALASIRQLFRGAQAITLRSVEVGLRPMPEDQLPIIGPSPRYQGLYLAVMHAGVTLAPTVARLIGQELLHGQTCAELAACRPARFA